MSLESIKAVIRRLFAEVFDQGQVDAIVELVAEDVIGHVATSEEPSQDRSRRWVLVFIYCYPPGYRAYGLSEYADPSAPDSDGELEDQSAP